MYLVSEYIVSVLLVFVVVTRSFAAFTAVIIVWEGIVNLTRAAFSTVNGLEQQVRRVLAPAVRQADTTVNTMQR